MALVITFSFHLHTYCIYLSGAGVATNPAKSPQIVKNNFLCKTHYGGRLQGLYLGCHSKGCRQCSLKLKFTSKSVKTHSN